MLRVKIGAIGGQVERFLGVLTRNNGADGVLAPVKGQDLICRPAHHGFLGRFQIGR